MSALTVFYSWQSDTESKVNRVFIREALETAIADLDIQDADRPKVDQDTKDVLGSPVVADIIFKKIKGASVVVADVTLTGSTIREKRLCNSNVAIELGYALGIHNDEVLLTVMNAYYGPPQDLPFDLAHRRWPVQYVLAPEAESAERNKVRNALARELRGILEKYIEVARNKQPKESSESEAAKKADLRAEFLRYGSNKYKLKISNRGPSSARNVRLEFPDGNDCVLLDDKFPFEIMEPYQSVDLIAVVAMETKSKHKIKLLWDDALRADNEKVVYATI
jgi:glycosyltransferase involved in cell wall biosynthesis